MKNGVVRELLPRERPRRQAEPVNAALDVNLAASPELRKALESLLAQSNHRQALAAATAWRPLFAAGLLPADAPDSVRDAVALRCLGFVPAVPAHVSFRFDARTGDLTSAEHGSPRQPVPPAGQPNGMRLALLLALVRQLHAELAIRDDGFLLSLTAER